MNGGGVRRAAKSAARAGEAGLQFRVHAQNMILNPDINGVVHLYQHGRAKSFLHGTLLEALKDLFEVFVRRTIFFMHRTVVAGHALFLVAEMGVNIVLKEVEELHDGGELRGRGIGLHEEALKLVEVADERAMLLINLRRAGGELFGP